MRARARLQTSIAAAGVVALALTGVVGAAWSGTGSGLGSANAQTVNVGNQPTASVAASSVTLSWAASALVPGGQTVSGYIVRRYDAGGVAQTTGPGCSGVVALLSCTETNVPNGAWQYSVTPALGNWRGAESPRRAANVTVPSVTSLSPNFAYRNRTQNLLVLGSGFVSGASVVFSGTGLTVNSTTFNSATQLTVNVTVASGAATGPRNVTVTNPSGLGSAVCVSCLTVPTGPTVSSAAPSTRGQGATNQTITISGNFFLSGATVTFSGPGITVNSTTFVSATQLTANVSVATGSSIGTRNITVTNPAGAGTGTCTACFTVTTRPGAFTLAPNSRGQGATNQSIAVTGSAFVNGATVAFSGTGITVNSTTFVSSTQLTLNISVDPAASTGTRNVTITNPDGGTRTVNGAFTVVVRPVPTSLNPAARARGTTGNEIVTGTGFVNGATVTFSAAGVTINSTTFNSATQLTVNVTVGAGAMTGPGNVTVTNPNAGTGSCAGCFTINP
jgi:hypothetical protein